MTRAEVQEMWKNVYKAERDRFKAERDAFRKEGTQLAAIVRASPSYAAKPVLERWDALAAVPREGGRPEGQRQDSLTDQLRDLHRHACLKGMYDAADFLQRAVVSGNEASPRGAAREGADAEVERLRAEVEACDQASYFWKDRAEKAEAELERLRAAGKATADWRNA